MNYAGRVQATTFETSSSEQTEAIGAALAGALEPGDLVLVEGELGAGKTTFVRGACRALGVAERITSPTFVIGRTYRGRVPVSHVDLYRLDALAGEDPALLADYLTPDAVGFVEWPQRAEGAVDLEEVVARVRIEHAGAERRRIEVAGTKLTIDALEQAVL